MFQRVIMIDDNEADNVFHQLVLEEAGFAGPIQVFELGAPAVAALAADPDLRSVLVLLDLNLPGLDGWEVARRLAPHLARRPHALVILTSSPNPDDRDHAHTIPQIQELLTKPLEVEDARRLLAGEGPAR